jgi:hypothetical protein
MSTDRNVLLIILDTVREDYFNKYAPRIQSLSDISFSQCRTASSCSVPSHASILTGTLPHRHGIYSTNVDYSSIDFSETFLSELPNHRTIGVSANTFAGSSFGFDSHFDIFQDVSWTSRFPQGIDVRQYKNETNAEGVRFYYDFLRECLVHENVGHSLANGVLAQLDLLSAKSPLPKLFDDGGQSVLKHATKESKRQDEPFFMFVNLMDAHTPHHHVRSYDRSIHDVSSSWTSIDSVDHWDVNLNSTETSETDLENFRSLYAASIDYLDRIVADFINNLMESAEKETTVILTADHGENLGFDSEDGLFGHSNSLSEGLLHVPLEIVNPPAGYSEIESEYFSQLDLGELIVGMSQNKTPDVFSETPVAERITTSAIPDTVEDKSFWNRTIRCAFTGEEKVVWDSRGITNVFELDHDNPCWQRLISETEEIPSFDDRFFEQDIQSTYEALVQTNSSFDVDDSTKERLEELGYL